MKNLVVLLSVLSLLVGQQGKYVRKSVSSLESVWFKPGSVSGMKFDSQTFDKFIDFYVEVDRFDYNVLPGNLIQDFRREANSIDSVNADAISEVLERTVTSKIVDILNDPAIPRLSWRDVTVGEVIGKGASGLVKEGTWTQFVPLSPCSAEFL